MSGVTGASPGETQYLVAHREAIGTFAEGGHHSGQIAALARGKRRRESLGERAGADRGFARIDARGLDRHDNLSRRRCWPWHVGDVENLPATVMIEAHRT